MERVQIPTTITPDNLPDLFYKDQPVITSESLALLYGSEVNNLKNNFANNKDRFEPERHFFKLTGASLKEFRTFVVRMNLQVENFDLQNLNISQKTRSLMLWTERGAARHAKMLNTDQAWDVFEKLEDAYFNRVPYGMLTGAGVASKEKKFNRIVTVFTGAKRLAKEMGLSGEDAILKAKEMTETTIGIDVFTSFNVSLPKKRQPEDYSDDVKVFFTELDRLLASGEVQDHSNKVDIVWIHMPTALENVERSIGRSFNRGILYHQLKKSDRYEEQKRAFNSKIFKKPVAAWAFKKNTSKI